jgi:hypothetical protein
VRSYGSRRVGYCCRMPYTRLSRWQWTRGHSKGFKNGPLETAGVAVSAVVSLVVAHWMGAKPDVTEIVATVIGSGIVGALLAPLAELAWRFAWAGRDQDQAELAVVREENVQLSRQIEELTSEAPPLVVDYELVAAPTSIPPRASACCSTRNSTTSDRCRTAPRCAYTRRTISSLPCPSSRLTV